VYLQHVRLLDFQNVLLGLLLCPNWTHCRGLELSRLVQTLTLGHLIELPKQDGLLNRSSQILSILRAEFGGLDRLPIDVDRLGSFNRRELLCKFRTCCE
jgi:hypothetical protein